MLRMKTFLAIAIVLAATSAFAQTPAPKPCAAPETHQFDFWLGEWNVFTPDGKQAGTHVLAPLYGCVLHES